MNSCFKEDASERIQMHPLFLSSNNFTAAGRECGLTV